LKYAGDALNDNQTISDAGIISDATVRLEISGPLEIYVLVKNRQITIEAEKNETLLVLKELIEDKVGIPTEE
jgi:hypothetical protein